MIIRISRDYSDTLGARNISDGDFSGEDFRENYLLPLYLKAKDSGEKITIDFDGGCGNPVSFVEEAFGGLARKFGSESVLATLEFISNDQEDLVDEVIDYITHPYDNSVYRQHLSRINNDNNN